jgi:two-component system, OmpR family, response regulator MprA
VGQTGNGAREPRLIASRSRILVAEDEPELREFVVEVLRAAGYEVEEVKNGVEALEAIRRVPPAVLVLDVQMPVMDGLDVLRALRDEGVGPLPVVVMTAGTRVSSLPGVGPVFIKPLNVESFMRAVETLAATRRLKPT